MNWFTRLSLGFVVTLCSPLAHATVITDGCVNANVSCTLEELAAGASLTVDDLRFHSWSLFEDVISDSTRREIRAFEVTGLDNSLFNPGLDFQGEVTSGAGALTVRFRTRFVVEDLGGVATIKDHSLGLGDHEFIALDDGPGDNGLVSVRDFLSDTGATTPFAITEVIDYPRGNELQLNDEVLFEPRSLLRMSTSVFVTVNDDPDLQAKLYGFSQHFSRVPEPGALGLLGAGLGGLLIMRRKRTR